MVALGEAQVNGANNNRREDGGVLMVEWDEISGKDQRSCKSQTEALRMQK